MVEGSQSSDGDRSPKRQRKDETPKQDRISAMPDEILLHILSFLPTKEAVKAGALSHRWLYLWNSVPSLNFTCDSKGSHYLRKFAAFFVSRTLIFHRFCPVNKFIVNFDYKNSFASHVDAWVRFATSRNVEDLGLHFDGYGDLYTLPQHLYTNSSITKLKLKRCDVVPNGLICWKSLKSLSIGYTELSEDVIQKILVGSPVLEFLELYNFRGFDRLDIFAVSLRKLVLRDHWDSTNIGDDSTLEIYAPNLQSLGILGKMARRKFSLMNVQSLEDCTLNFGLQNYIVDREDDYEVNRNVLRELLDRLRHVKKLTFGEHCIQVLSIMELNGMLSPLPKCKCLILGTYIKKCDAPGIAGLLSSPNLETLVINMTSLCDVSFLYGLKYYLDKRFPENYWMSELGSSKGSPLHLKTVKIVGFLAQHCEVGPVIPLLQFLLEKARVLEKIIIRARRDMECSPKELLQVAQKLQRLPRISPHAIVMFTE